MGRHSDDDAERDRALLSKAAREALNSPREGKRTHEDDVKQTEDDYGVNLRGKRGKSK